jgi:superfamily II DNA or RNA helicase
MINHFEELKFTFSWRDYQARVLQELESHLDDDHLHVVAAPGSGKTVLGIEVMRKLGNASVVLAPSIAIRTQWIERIIGMFMADDGKVPNWISTDIRRPKFLTVITYQALNSVFSESVDKNSTEFDQAEESLKPDLENAIDEASVLALLHDLNVKTLVLDEAHHLRKEWWKSLTQLKAGLPDRTLVSLTATPPYDVEPSEWHRYEELCGPIDTEIPVPELVKCKDLCPHQDYVFFSLPTEEELERARQFTDDVEHFVRSLKSDDEFFSIVSSHDWLHEPEFHVENILGDPQLYSALIIYLSASGFKVSRDVLNILGVKRKDIPSLDARWLEVFLSRILFTEIDQFAGYADKFKEIRAELKRIGAVERRKVVVQNTKALQQLLAGSLGKLNSIKQIAKLESQKLGESLRMVILTDYIRKDQLSPGNKAKSIDKIGVVPNFNYLDRAKIKGIRLGILTGSLVVIPSEAVPILKGVALELGVALASIGVSPLAHNETYSQIELRGQARHKTVGLITEVFNRGGVTTLVGTQALLGEGWDAPTVNTLVLASFVGSYMLSNQMRGRAIRVDPNVPDKTANIWHLVALDLESMQDKIQSIFLEKVGQHKAIDPFDEVKENLGDDMVKMRRRFRAFEGLSHRSPHVIENGFKRLGLADVEWSPQGVKDLNLMTINSALARNKLHEMWDSALQGKSKNPKMHDRVEVNYVPRMLSFIDTLEFLVLNALLVSAMYIEQVFNGLGRQLGRNISFEWFFAILLIVPMFYTLPKLLKALYIFIRNGTVENSMRQVGLAVTDSLCRAGLIKTNRDQLEVIAMKEHLGAVACRLTGSTAIERRAFMDAMQQVLGPMDNPKYLLIRKSRLGFVKRTDYHAVPKLLGQKKQYAEYFAERWKKHVGKSELVYTRTLEGRQTLLRARTRSMASAFQKKTDRVSVWE